MIILSVLLELLNFFLKSFNLYTKSFISSNEIVLFKNFVIEKPKSNFIYQDKETPSYQERAVGYSPQPLSTADLRLSEADFDALVKEFL